MNLLWLLVIVLVVLAIFGAPQFGYHQYGYAPSGLGTVLAIILIIWLLGGLR